MRKHIDQDESSIFISADRDYVPILNKIREEGKKVITVSFNDRFPIEIQNESYEILNMEDYYRNFFIYNYPEYNIRTITLDEFKNMYANADDYMQEEYQGLKKDCAYDKTGYIDYKI